MFEWNIRPTILCFKVRQTDQLHQSRNLKHFDILPDNTEQVDVGIVDSKVYKDDSCPSLNPSVVKQVVDDV